METNSNSLVASYAPPQWFSYLWSFFLLFCSVEDFEGQKAFYRNEEKRKDKRSLMSNNQEDDNL